MTYLPWTYPVRGFGKVRHCTVIYIVVSGNVILQSSSGKAIKGIEAHVWKLINQVHQVIFVIELCLCLK